MRRALHVLHLVAAALVVVGVFVQVYLIAAYAFGAHEAAGNAVVALELAVLVAAVVARLRRPELILSTALVVAGFAQFTLSGGERWVGGLHGLLALVVLILATVIVHRDLKTLGIR